MPIVISLNPFRIEFESRQPFLGGGGCFYLEILTFRLLFHGSVGVSDNNYSPCLYKHLAIFEYGAYKTGCIFSNLLYFLVLQNKFCFLEPIFDFVSHLSLASSGIIPCHYHFRMHGIICLQALGLGRQSRVKGPYLED